MSASWNKHQLWTTLSSVSTFFPSSLPSFLPSPPFFLLPLIPPSSLPHSPILPPRLLIFSLSFSYATNNISIETKKRQLCSGSLHPERSTTCLITMPGRADKPYYRTQNRQSLVTELEQSPFVIPGGSEIQFIELFKLRHLPR